MDNLMIDLVSRVFAFSQSWQDATFQKCCRIRLTRKATSNDYGFEWAIQTLMADYLLLELPPFHGTREIRINQPSDSSGYRPDIVLRAGTDTVFIEIKTTTEGDVSWFKKDIKKMNKYRVPLKRVYFLLVSYPFVGEWRAVPSGLMRRPLHEGAIVDGFRFSLWKMGTA